MTQTPLTYNWQQQVNDLSAALRILWPDRPEVTFPGHTKPNVTQLTHDEVAMLTRIADALALAREPGTNTATEWSAVERDYEGVAQPSISRAMAEADNKQNHTAGLESYLAYRTVTYGPWIEVPS